MSFAALPKTADVVVVGGGTVGAWCAYFLRQASVENVVLIEKGLLGQGASSRAAVTEEHPAFADTPMVFDVPSGHDAGPGGRPHCRGRRADRR